MDPDQGVNVVAASGGALGSGDAVSGDAGRDGIYTGCSYIGGYDRAVVTKFDPPTRTCVMLTLMSPMRDVDASANLTITSPWALVFAGMWTSTTADCLSKGVPSGAAQAASVSGSVTVHWAPATIDINAVCTFPSVAGGASRSVELKAQGLNIDRGC